MSSNHGILPPSLTRACHTCLRVAFLACFCCVPLVSSGHKLSRKGVGGHQPQPTQYAARSVIISTFICARTRARVHSSISTSEHIVDRHWTPCPLGDASFSVASRGANHNHTMLVTSIGWRSLAYAPSAAIFDFTCLLDLFRGFRTPSLPGRGPLPCVCRSPRLSLPRLLSLPCFDRVS